MIRTFIFALSLCLLHAPAFAQDDFAATVQEGLREFETGNWVEARALFLAAHEIRASAEALRMAGNASYENRDYVLAVELLTRALGGSEGTLRPHRVPQAEEALAAASRFVTALEVQTTHPRITVDGRPIEANAPVLLLRGPHTLEVSGPGFQTERRELNLASERETLEISLRPDVAPVPDEPMPIEDESRSRTGLWVTLAVVGVAIAGGVVAAILLTRDDGPPFGANAPSSIIQTLEYSR